MYHTKKKRTINLRESDEKKKDLNKITLKEKGHPEYRTIIKKKNPHQ